MVSFPSDDLTLAVPVTGLGRVVNSASGKVSPLKPPAVQMPSGERFVVNPNQPAQVPTSELQRTGSLCREFDWIPASDEQLDLLIEFLRAVGNAKTFLKENPTDYRDSEEVQAARFALQQSLDNWSQQVHQRYQLALLESNGGIGKLNQLSLKRISRPNESIVPIFGTVDTGMSQLDQILFHTHTGDSYFDFEFDAEAPVFRPGTHWLFLIENTADSSQRIFQIPHSNRIKSRSIGRLTQIGPIGN